MLSGNGIEKLAQLVSELRDLSRGAAVAPVTRSVAAEAVTRIKASFEHGVSPYGDPYSPVARGGQPLNDTRRLRNAFMDDSVPGRVVVSNPTVYARLMNDGGTVTAKNKPYLTFKMKLPGVARAMRGGRVTQRGRSQSQWVKVKQVTIRARPFLPDARGLPDEWGKRFEAVAKDAFRKGFPALGAG
jgi:phage gpG-like protein